MTLNVRFLMGSPSQGAETRVYEMPGVPGIYEQVVIDGLAWTVSQVVWTPGHDPECWLSATWRAWPPPPTEPTTT